MLARDVKTVHQEQLVSMALKVLTRVTIAAGVRGVPQEILPVRPVIPEKLSRLAREEAKQATVFGVSFYQYRGSFASLWLFRPEASKAAAALQRPVVINQTVWIT